jgi:hypothetical protein
MKTFTRENWEAANERLVYFLKQLADVATRTTFLLT